MNSTIVIAVHIRANLLFLEKPYIILDHLLLKHRCSWIFCCIQYAMLPLDLRELNLYRPLPYILHNSTANLLHMQLFSSNTSMTLHRIRLMWRHQQNTHTSRFSLLFSFYYHLISGKIYDCGAHLPPAFYNNKPIIWYENGHGFYSFFKKNEIFFVFCCITPKTGIVYCFPPHIRFQCDFSGHKKTSGILQLRKSYFCSAITAIRR